MGAAAIPIAGLALAGASKVAAGASNIQGREAKVGQLRLQQTQERMAAENASIQRNKQLESVLSNAQAQASARGISGASGSFKSVQEKSIQRGITADRISDLNLSLKETKLRQSIDALQKKTIGDRFTSLLTFGTGMGGFKSFDISKIVDNDKEF